MTPRFFSRYHTNTNPITVNVGYLLTDSVFLIVGSTVSLGLALLVAQTSSNNQALTSHCGYKSQIFYVSLTL
ncbi:Hypothetical predicted protein [Octopus vulgaris]|uniref:Uncharacterized protein n=1 Tax=Octopus vulgaris TaxID=6645 RepID=A0AA36AL53_OCTVU|nr:Hypothetical predicted protein [Octopus vulgaris]